MAFLRARTRATRQPHTARPMVGGFAWIGSRPEYDPCSRRMWSPGSGLTRGVGPAGRSVNVPGNSTTGYTRGGFTTAALRRFTAIAIARWSNTGTGSFPQLLGTSTSNTGFRLGGTYSSGATMTFGLTKGGVVSLNTITINADEVYIYVCSHEQAGGDYYILGRSLTSGTRLVATQTNTSASSAGNGFCGVGIARTDYAGSWGGDIYAAYQDAIYLPRPAGEAILDRAWQVWGERRIIVPVSAGNIITADLTESISVADSISQVAILAPTLAESIAASDSLAATSTQLAALSEAITVTDACTGAATRPVSVSETASLADSVTAISTAVATLTETLGAADTVSAIATLVAAVSEAIAAADAVQVNAVTASITEAASLTDAITVVASMVAQVAEAAAAGDAVTAAAQLVALVSEPVSLADSVSTGGNTYPVSLTELITVLDAITAVVIEGGFDTYPLAGLAQQYPLQSLAQTYPLAGRL